MKTMLFITCCLITFSCYSPSIMAGESLLECTLSGTLITMNMDLLKSSVSPPKYCKDLSVEMCNEYIDIQLKRIKLTRELIDSVEKKCDSFRNEKEVNRTLNNTIEWKITLDKLNKEFFRYRYPPVNTES